MRNPWEAAAVQRYIEGGRKAKPKAVAYVDIEARGSELFLHGDVLLYEELAAEIRPLLTDDTTLYEGAGFIMYQIEERAFDDASYRVDA